MQRSGFDILDPIVTDQHIAQRWFVGNGKFVAAQHIHAVNISADDIFRMRINRQSGRDHDIGVKVAKRQPEQTIFHYRRCYARGNHLVGDDMPCNAVNRADRLLDCPKPCDTRCLTRFEVGQRRKYDAGIGRCNQCHDDGLVGERKIFRKRPAFMPDAISHAPDCGVVGIADGKASDDGRHSFSPQLRQITRAGAG